MAPLDTMMTSRPSRPARQLPAPFADGAFVQAAALVGDQAGADLHHDAAHPRVRMLQRLVAVTGILAHASGLSLRRQFGEARVDFHRRPARRPAACDVLVHALTSARNLRA
jgi:hypothetical protein